MRRLAIVLAAPAGLALAAGAIRAEESRSAVRLAATPPAEVRAELSAVCESQPDSDEPYTYVGRRAIARLEAELAQPNLVLAARLKLLLETAHAHLRLGALDTAEDRFRKVLALADALPPEVLWRVRRDLALLELLRAERSNCVLHHGAESCLYPIRPGGIHLQPEPARRAAAAYEELLREDPQSAQIRWLLHLTRSLAGEPSSAAPAPSPVDFPLWRERAAVTGLAAFDLAGGAVVDDFDGDGRLDVITSTTDPCDHAKAFRNRGDGTFDDVSLAWGLDVQLGGLNLVHADFDNDGRPDLLILRGGWLHETGKVRNSLLRNDLAASGRFLDVTVAAGIAYPAYPTQAAAWADYDGDGWLDLYVGNESVRSDPSPSQLFRSDGDGTFTNVTLAAGVTNMAYAKGAAWGDFDDDGRPDLYVSNLGSPSRLYRNRGDGTFEDVASAMGVEAPLSGFATWFFDFDQDGRLDLFVADYGARYDEVSASYLGEPTSGGRPALYRNEGERFRDVAAESGFDRPLLPMGANFGDLDNDGWPDIYLGTGVPDLEALMPNVMYRNLGGGRFADVTAAGGFGHLQKGHGIGFADLNDDGQPEVFAQMGGFFPVDAFYNALFVGPGNGNAWLQLELVGERANRSGLGARITVEVETPTGRRRVHQQITTGGSFGGSPHRAQIGLGDATAIVSIVVRWPGSGTVDTLGAVALAQRYRLVEGSGRLVPLPLQPFAWPEPAPER